MVKSLSNLNENQYEKSFEAILKLDCPVCLEKIESKHIFQCNNGHLICKNCIPKLERCPICRNKSQPSRNLKLEEVISSFENFHTENREIPNQKFKTLHWKGKLVQENDETLKEEIEFYKSQSRLYLFATFFLIGLLCVVHINLYLQKHFEIECVVFHGDEKIYCDPQSIKRGLKIVRNSQNE